MTNPIFLTQQEVENITGKHRYRAQARALARMGIECRIRPDGRPIVSRLAFERIMNGNAPKVDIEPDFEALRNRLTGD